MIPFGGSMIRGKDQIVSTSLRGLRRYVSAKIQTDQGSFNLMGW